VQLLRRFADGRNEDVSEKVNADGSNIEPKDSILRVWIISSSNTSLFLSSNLVHLTPKYLSPPEEFRDGFYRFFPPLNSAGTGNTNPALFQASWVLHLAWIRLLHYRSLAVGPDLRGMFQLQHILLLTLAFYILEINIVPFRPQSEQVNRPEFGSLGRLFDRVKNVLVKTAVDLQTENRPQPGPYSLTQTMLYNFNPRRLAAIVNRVGAGRSCVALQILTIIRTLQC
jgi:hypothetical protein